ncbi:YcxB family protein [Marinifilum sp. D714]|uniref:YcxB family protein n=1 Tax=Marinifilum sp. D714 TaxID=2937523 RepID=UPI0027C25228|nr:YcxB family protein [Marinifilum sp. D714]MDQ2178760.1 YcxB family protein [Marinifilum sp. D714]
MKTEITREDFLQFNKHVQSTINHRKPILFAFSFLILFVIVMNIGKPFDLLSIVTEIFLIIVLWGLIFVVFKQIGLSKIKKMPYEKGGILGERIYLIEDKGFREISNSSETFTNWNGFKEIQESKDHYYLFVVKIAAYIIPKRSFSNGTEEEEFINTINKKILKYNTGDKS